MDCLWTVQSCTFGARAFAIAGPTVWNYLPDSLPDSLRDPAVGPHQFRRDLKTHLFVWHCVSFSALAVFLRNALYKSTFYLLIYLLVLAPALNSRPALKSPWISEKWKGLELFWKKMEGLEKFGICLSWKFQQDLVTVWTAIVSCCKAGRRTA